jgi:hypothetical protein
VGEIGGFSFFSILGKITPFRDVRAPFRDVRG